MLQVLMPFVVYFNKQTNPVTRNIEWLKKIKSSCSIFTDHVEQRVVTLLEKVVANCQQRSLSVSSDTPC